MRFHCNCCHSDFTTLSAEKEKKVAFSHFIIDKMTCPNCGASNQKKKLKPLKQTRSRWQPKRKSIDSSELAVPNVVLHQYCQSRICGSISSGKVTVVCDGCPSAFNCLTGNVDDGLNDNVSLEEIKDRKIISRAELVKEAEVKVAEKKSKDEEKQLLEMAELLRKKGFSYGINVEKGLGDGLSAKYQGTIWKLDDDDKQAIINDTWQTLKTKTMKNTLANHDIPIDKARDLLCRLLRLDKADGM